MRGVSRWYQRGELPGNPPWRTGDESSFNVDRVDSSDVVFLERNGDELVLEIVHFVFRFVGLAGYGGGLGGERDFVAKAVG